MNKRMVYGILTLLLASSVIINAKTEADPVPYYDKYETQRNAVVDWELAQYDSDAQLLKGDSVGGCGYQADTYNLINVNFFGAQALGRYDATVSSAIYTEMNSLLSSIGYMHNDRREIIFGNPIAFPPKGAVSTTISGTPPAADCSTAAVDWVNTELPTSNSLANYTANMNSIVPALLEKYREGDITTAQSLFNTAVGWWHDDSTYKKGFLTTAAQNDNKFYVRDLAYFLIAQRATRFTVSSTILDAVEQQLWSMQLSKYDGGLDTVYRFNGLPFANAGHTSGEINALALIAYDPRIQSTWFPD